jgi:hypothetical protein
MAIFILAFMTMADTADAKSKLKIEKLKSLDIDISDDEGDEDEDENEANEQGPGFEVAFAIFGLLVIAGIVHFRRD